MGHQFIYREGLRIFIPDSRPLQEKTVTIGLVNRLKIALRTACQSRSASQARQNYKIPYKQNWPVPSDHLEIGLPRPVENC